MEEKAEIVVCEQELISEPLEIWGFNTKDGGENVNAE